MIIGFCSDEVESFEIVYITPIFLKIFEENLNH